MTAQFNSTITQDRILILDFGSQYSQLIARRVREAGVYSEMHPFDMSDEDIQSLCSQRHYPVRRA